MSAEDSTGEAEIHALVKRLARPHSSGGHVVERAALLASGSGFTAATTWIADHGGVAEARAPLASRRGLHGQRLGLSEGPGQRVPLRFVLPAGAFD